MASQYKNTLLQQRASDFDTDVDVDAARDDAATAAATHDAPHVHDDEIPAPFANSRRSVSYPAMPAPAPQPMYAPPAQPMPMPMQYAPQPVYVQSSGVAGSSRGASVLLAALVVVLVAILASIGGYLLAKNAAPTPVQTRQVTATAARSAFVSGRAAGIREGRAAGLAQGRNANRSVVARAREVAYNKGFANGRKAGRSSYRSPARYYGSGYAPRRGYGWGNYGWGGFGGGVTGALAQAQNLANVTGAPVDVEIY